jgi:hypothetical protein
MFKKGDKVKVISKPKKCTGVTDGTYTCSHCYVGEEGYVDKAYSNGQIEVRYDNDGQWCSAIKARNVVLIGETTKLQQIINDVISQIRSNDV